MPLSLSRRRFALGVGSSALVPALPSPAGAQASGSAAPGPGISVLLPSPGYPDALIDAFERATGIDVDQRLLPWDDLEAHLPNSLLANTVTADVVEVDWSWVGEFGVAHRLAPLAGRVEAAPPDRDPLAPLFRYGGEAIAKPYVDDFKMMTFNRDHLTRAGFKEPPATVDMLVEAARAVRAKGIAPYPVGLPLGTGEATTTAWFLMTVMEDGDVVDAGGGPAFVDPSSGGHRALGLIRRLVDEKLVTPASTGAGDAEVDEIFEAGQASFTLSNGPASVDGRGRAGHRVRGGAELALVPNVSGRSRTFGLPEALGIPAISPRKAEAAAFISWVTGRDQQVRAFAGSGFLPPDPEAIAALDQSGALRGAGVIAEQVKGLRSIFPDGAPTWYRAFSRDAAAAINGLALGQTDVEGAAATIAAAFDRARRGD